MKSASQYLKCAGFFVLGLLWGAPLYSLIISFQDHRPFAIRQAEKMAIKIAALDSKTNLGLWAQGIAVRYQVKTNGLSLISSKEVPNELKAIGEGPYLTASLIETNGSIYGVRVDWGPRPAASLRIFTASSPGNWTGDSNGDAIAWVNER